MEKEIAIKTENVNVIYDWGKPSETKALSDINTTIYEEDLLSDIVSVEKFSGLTVQKRRFHPNKGPIEIPEALKLAPKILAE